MAPPEDIATPEGVRLYVRDGDVYVDAPAEVVGGTALLAWTPGSVRVTLFGEVVEEHSCRVPANSPLSVEPVRDEPGVRYLVDISRDRMQATMKVVVHPGIERTIVDAEPSDSLKLQVNETPLDPPVPDVHSANAALQRAGVVHGIDADAVAAAVADPGIDVVIAAGTDPVEGRNGKLEPLIDFEELRLVGVMSDTPLVRRVRKQEGRPGRDVTGKELQVAPVRDVRIRAGHGVSVDEHGILAIATVDGSPRLDSEGHVEVRHELVIEEVDAVSGDINFYGSVHVTGSVHEGRHVTARDELIVEGNVDRAHLSSAGSMRIDGSIMSSVLRAGGERAVAAAIADRVLAMPKALGLASIQARQFRDVAGARGTDISHGLSLQLMFERNHRQVLTDMASVSEELREAGPSHLPTANRIARWHRDLSTAANNSLTAEQFQELLVEVGSLAEDVQRAIEQPADLTVTYMQACEAEATGRLTITGKGVFNSRIVAWGGVDARQYEAVFRGGSILSHGDVHVREVGSPAGVKTTVQLGHGASLEADHAFAGTTVIGPGYTHRFVADRMSVHVTFDSSGAMNVESLAA